MRRRPGYGQRRCWARACRGRRGCVRRAATLRRLSRHENASARGVQKQSEALLAATRTRLRTWPGITHTHADSCRHHARESAQARASHTSLRTRLASCTLLRTSAPLAIWANTDVAVRYRVLAENGVRNGVHGGPTCAQQRAGRKRRATQRKRRQHTCSAERVATTPARQKIGAPPLLEAPPQNGRTVFHTAISLVGRSELVKSAHRLPQISNRATAWPVDFPARTNTNPSPSPR